jgi:hypothetical protein
MTRIALIVALLAGLGCGPPSGTSDTDEGSNETGELDEGSCEPWNCTGDCWAPELAPHSLDILVVIDGSPGSAGAQARLAASLEQLVVELDASEGPLDYRIAFTTTDMGPPACDPLLTTPEQGRFLASSCRARLDDFVDLDGQDFTSLCTDACSLEVVERLPTKIGQEQQPAARAWIERDGDHLNLPADVELAEALRCIALAGVSGCPFESPLAAMEAAVLGSNTPGHPNFGFFRPQSRWAFVIVSDAVDCSWTEAGAPVFDPAGERAFWSDPQAEAPTPALCWNAGTFCTSVDGALECDPYHYDVHGFTTTDPDEMVLRETTYYRDLLRYSGGGWHNDFVLFTGLTLDGALVYTEAEDPELALEHGIGPGCDDQAGTVALPPVRLWRFLREVRDLDSADDYVALHAASICARDFGPPLTALGQRMRDSVGRPDCYFSLLCDVDPSTELLDVECELEAWAPGLSDVEIPECARGGDGAYLVEPDTGRPMMPDAEAPACYVARVDADGHTADPLDDAWLTCIEEGAPLGLEVVTRDGRWPEDWTIEARCREPTF